MRAKKLENLFNYAALQLAILLVGAVSAAGQVQALSHTFVSANGGSDSNTCSQISPCRQVTRAMEYTTAGGTVTILASGDYERFTIDKSISIVAEQGVNAVITGGSVNSVSIGFDVSNVRLRNLTIYGGGSYGSTAIQVSNEIGSLEVDNCIIRSGEKGIAVRGAGVYLITNTRFGGAVTNLEFFTTSGQVNAVVENCSFSRGGAMTVGRNARVTIRNSVANGGGFRASTSTAKLMIDNCVINGGFDDGVVADSGGFIRIGNSTITNNAGYGIRVISGNVKSYGTNRIFNNGLGDISGTVGLLSGQ